MKTPQEPQRAVVRQQDLALLNDLQAALQQEKHHGKSIVVTLLFALLLTFLLWAYFSELEEVTRGQGRVIPSSREQVIQSLEPGLIAEMLVKEGDLVAKDQVLLRLDNARSGAMYRESLSKAQSLTAMVSRLRAEAFDLPLEFPAGLPQELQDRERSALRARTHMLSDSLAGMQKTKALLDREIEITEPMVQQGVMSEVELLRSKRQSSDLGLQITDRLNKFRSDANTELSKAEAELGQARENAAGRNDSFVRSEIRSPLRGIVKNVRINTVGGVVSQAQEILEIVPLDDTLLVEAYIRPSDVAFIHPGQDALVKLSAYDYSLFGGLEGKVEYLSPDTLRDERRTGQFNMNSEEVYYRVLVRTEGRPLTDKTGKALPIIPGMIANVDIKTGHKTVMQYLFKPITRLKQAMQER